MELRADARRAERYVGLVSESMQYTALDGTVHDKKEDAVFASVQHQLRNQLIEQLTKVRALSIEEVEAVAVVLTQNMSVQQLHNIVDSALVTLADNAESYLDVIPNSL